MLVFNENTENEKLERFIFISESKGINSLKNSAFFKGAISLIKGNSLKKIELFGISKNEDTYNISYT